MPAMPMLQQAPEQYHTQGKAFLQIWMEIAHVRIAIAPHLIAQN